MKTRKEKELAWNNILILTNQFYVIVINFSLGKFLEKSKEMLKLHIRLKCDIFKKWKI